MRSVNTVVIPEYGRELVLQSVRDAENEWKKNEQGRKNVSLDFYYHHNIDKHIEEYFPSDSLSQIPTFPQKIVPRFARARMLLYKLPPKRFISGEESEDYKNLAHSLDSRTRTFAELTWLLGGCGLRTKWNDRSQRIEYDVLPNYKRYYIEGEADPFGVSYEVGKDTNEERKFVFWSEARDGDSGYHFTFTQGGRIVPVNEDYVNPYGIIPVSFADFETNAGDVVRSAIQIGIATTEIALGVRYSLGQPVLIGLGEDVKLRGGIDQAIQIPEGASFSYVSPTGSLNEMIEAVKSFANITAENNHLRVRWGDTSGNPPSGEALKILEIENLEARESDMQIFREWEKERYEIDRAVVQTHTGRDLGEDYVVDFGEAQFPMSQMEELEVLKMKKEMGIITQRDILKHFNPDAQESEIQEKLNQVQAETPTTEPLFGELRGETGQ